MVRGSLAWVVVGCAFAVWSACGEDPQQLPGFTSGAGNGSGGDSGDGGSGTGGGSSNTTNTTGSGFGGFNEGGQPPAPVFDLDCGGESCLEGEVCCLQGGLTLGCVALAACDGVPLACDDEDDCNAGGGSPEVCCAIFEADVFDRAECTSKGACSGTGHTYVCKSLDECDECAAIQGGEPAGWMTCGPPL